MRRFIGSGFIARIDGPKKVGDTQITTISVPCNVRTKNANGEWQNDDQRTIWCELSAFNEHAESWARRFSKGDAVEFSGEPEMNVYLKGDGKPAASLRIRCAPWDLAHVPSRRQHGGDGAGDLDF